MNLFESEVSQVGPAELPRVEDAAVDVQTFAVGYTPTRSGDWVVPLLIQENTVAK